MVFQAVKNFFGFAGRRFQFHNETANPAKANLGCGKVFHPAWGNYDLCPASPGILPLDLERPLPFSDRSLEAVYSSHVLEHLPRSRVPGFLAECRRVLRPGGVLRLVVPDLEAITREYLRYLEAAQRGEPEAAERHEWMTVELLDQLVRRASGGFMARWWRSRPLAARELIEQRLGAEATAWIILFQEEAKDGGKLLSPEEIYQAEEPGAKKVTQFLQEGETHRWMYDRVSLGRLLREAGFREPQVCLADQSRIPGFSSYQLDTDETGRIRKPDSLFMEAVT